MKVFLLRSSLLLGAVAALAAPARAQVDTFMNNVVKEPSRNADGPTDAKIAYGLKEALQSAVESAVGQAGHVDGYYANPAIRITLPDQLLAMDRSLRAAGLGAQSDDFVRSMNRAAEQSVPAARQLLLEAIRGIGFENARRILGAGGTAATDYFRARAADRLRLSFAPTVRHNMDETGVTQRYEALTERAAALPAPRAAPVDLDAYLSAKTLDGLYYMMGEQEQEIRRNPAARSTTLLREIFAR
jgi:hypothetical protein